MNFRSKHWSLIALMAAFVLTVTGLSSPASALTSRALSIKASPAYTYAGTPITFSGSVTRSPKGTIVKIQRKSGASWVAVGQTTTKTAAGAYSVKLNAPATPAAYTYRALAPKTSKLAGVYSTRTTKSTVLRHTSATLTIVPSTVSIAETTTFSGTVAPFVRGTVVTLQRLSGASWVGVGRTNLAANGSYTLSTQAPAAAGTFSYRVQLPLAGLNAGTVSATKTLAVLNPEAPVITTTTLPDGDQYLAYSTTLTKTGNDGTWSIPAGTLPGGLSLNATTGVISGTPTGSGSRNLAVTFTATGSGLVAYKSVPITINPGPAITTATLPNATQGVAYTTTLTKTGRAGTWSILGLPAGLSIDATSGVISGTTTVAVADYGVYPIFTETVGGRSILKALTLHVDAGQVTPPNGPVVTTSSLPDVTQGVAYAATVSKSGQTGSWSATGLPSGLTINATSGVISGTTNAAVGDNAVNVKFTETASTLFVQKTLNLHVKAPATGGDAPVITTTSLPDGNQYLAYTTTLTKTGGAGTWSVPNGTLPGGLSLDASTGVLSGTPTGSGTRTLSITFKETSSGLSSTKGLAITISAAPTITTTSLPDATRGAAYTATLAKTGGAGTWSIQNLPTGLGINATTGVISGTTNVAIGDYGVYPTFTETATGRQVLKALSLHVGGTALAITTDTYLPDGHKALAYSLTFAKSGGAGTWTSTALPDGLTLGATTGVLSGTPTTAGITAFYVTFTETSSSASVTKLFGLTVVAPKVTTTTIPDGVTGTAYSQQFAKTGLDGTWQVAGILPQGINFSAAGLLSGTPTETGDFGLIVTFTETSTGASSKHGYVLHISAPGAPTITTTSLPNGTIGTAYSASLAATPTGGTWAITTGSLPVGLTLNATTGAITGTPTVPEAAFFVVTYTKGATQNTKFFTLTVPTP